MVVIQTLSTRLLSPHRTAAMRSHECHIALFQSAGYARGYVSHALLHSCTNAHRLTYACTQTQRRCNASTCADCFTVISSGYLLCPPDLHVAEFLCRSISVLATIQSRAQKCRYYLSNIDPRSRLLGRPAWDDWGVGLVKYHRCECNLYGRGFLQR